MPAQGEEMDELRGSIRHIIRLLGEVIRTNERQEAEMKAVRETAESNFDLVVALLAIVFLVFILGVSSFYAFCTVSTSCLQGRSLLLQVSKVDAREVPAMRD